FSQRPSAPPPEGPPSDFAASAMPHRLSPIGLHRPLERGLATINWAARQPPARGSAKGQPLLRRSTTARRPAAGVFVSSAAASAIRCDCRCLGAERSLLSEE